MIIKLLKIKGFIAGIIGALLMLGGVIGFLVGGEFLCVKNFYNWFFIANSFLIISILSFLITIACKEDKKET